MNYSKNLNNDVLQKNGIAQEPTLNDDRVICVDSEKAIHGLTETFHFTSTSKIDNVSSIGKIELLSFEIKEEEIVCTLSKFLQDENINLQFYYENALVDNVTLYFASTNLY